MSREREDELVTQRAFQNGCYAMSSCLDRQNTTIQGRQVEEFLSKELPRQKGSVGAQESSDSDRSWK